MKAITSVITAFRDSDSSGYNFKALAKLVGILIVLVVAFSVTFHWIMESEGKEHSWATGFYWTLTVMSTLGFGDITFDSDAGRIFSIIVLVTGVIFLLVLLPFTFIEFFYAPWIKAQENAKAPQSVPPGTRRHVIFTRLGPVTKMLSRMLDDFGYPYFVLVPTVEEALKLRSSGVPVVVGDRSDPESYRRCSIETAAMVVTTLDDVTNTNVTFTVRELSDSLPIVASATSDQVRDVLDLAGATKVMRLEKMMGLSLARRVIGNDAAAHVIGELDDLIIAEANPAKTPLVGKTIAECQVRAETGVTIVGLWVRGSFKPAEPGAEIGSHSVLVLAGTKAQIERYNEIFGQHRQEENKILIIGGGRVGRATAEQLTEASVEWTILEKESDRVRDHTNTIIGDASDFDVLVKAGLRDAATVIVTTHDDDLNVFLTIFYRRLRNDVQIISRCTQDKYAARMHRAGADLTLSYASMGANTVFNELRSSDTVLLAEGVNIFTTAVPRALIGKSVAESAVRSRTGCSIIAVEIGGERAINPAPALVLAAEAKLVLIGTLEAEQKFFSAFKLRETE
ncbi:MAG: voltage-gated potassium channel [Verrucomicrobiales bacterium]|jgi:voltage-gated potassium channel